MIVSHIILLMNLAIAYCDAFIDMICIRLSWIGCKKKSSADYFFYRIVKFRFLEHLWKWLTQSWKIRRMFVGMSRIPEGFFHIINYIFFKRYYTYLSGPKDHRKKMWDWIRHSSRNDRANRLKAYWNFIKQSGWNFTRWLIF